MSSFVLVILGVAALVLVLRRFFFVRLRFRHAPYCPVCGESRGRVLGVGETSGHAYFRCPHCGNVFEDDKTE